MEFQTNEEIPQMVEEKTIPERNNLKLTEKVFEPHNEEHSLLRTIIKGRMEGKRQEENQE